VPVFQHIVFSLCHNCLFYWFYQRIRVSKKIWKLIWTYRSETWGDPYRFHSMDTPAVLVGDFRQLAAGSPVSTDRCHWPRARPARSARLTKTDHSTASAQPDDDHDVTSWVQERFIDVVLSRLKRAAARKVLLHSPRRIASRCRKLPRGWRWRSSAVVVRSSSNSTTPSAVRVTPVVWFSSRWNRAATSTLRSHHSTASARYHMHWTQRSYVWPTGDYHCRVTTTDRTDHSSVSISRQLCLTTWKRLTGRQIRTITVLMMNMHISLEPVRSIWIFMTLWLYVAVYPRDAS